ncbi:MAG: hypothetical protein RL042_358 [Nitrospirota bacterium]
MGPSRTELMQFKVTPEERKLIEKVAKKKDFTVSEYVRASVIMDMVLDGEVGAMKIVVDTIGRKAVQALRKRADQLADLGAEATDSQ